MPDFAWMAWTWQTAIFFAVIAGLLALMTALAVWRPETERGGGGGGGGPPPPPARCHSPSSFNGTAFAIAAAPVSFGWMWSPESYAGSSRLG